MDRLQGQRAGSGEVSWHLRGVVVDDRPFMGEVYGEGESRREGQENLVHFEFKRIDAAQDPGCASEGLLFQRLVIQADPHVVPRGKLCEIVPDPIIGVDGVGGEGRDKHGAFMVEVLDLFDCAGADSGYPLRKDFFGALVIHGDTHGVVVSEFRSLNTRTLYGWIRKKSRHGQALLCRPVKVRNFSFSDASVWFMNRCVRYPAEKSAFNRWQLNTQQGPPFQAALVMQAYSITAVFIASRLCSLLHFQLTGFRLPLQIVVGIDKHLYPAVQAPAGFGLIGCNRSGFSIADGGDAATRDAVSLEK